jgi:hypothetical protein
MIHMIQAFIVHNKGQYSNQQETPESKVHAVVLVTFLVCGKNYYYLVHNYLGDLGWLSG